MKKIFLIAIVLFPVILFSQTKNIVPRADGEGSIGTLLKAWGDAHFDSLFLGGISLHALLNTKLDNDFMSYPTAHDVGGEDYLTIYEDVQQGIVKVSLGDLPMSEEVSLNLTEQNNKISDLATSIALLELQNTALELVNASQQATLDSLGLRIDALAPAFPYTPTNLIASATSSSNINLTWNGGFRDYDAAFIFTSQSGTEYAKLAVQNGSDSTYSHTSLNASSLYYYYVMFYDSATNTQSFQSNIDTSTTFSDYQTFYYVSATATGTGDGSEVSPYTVSQANIAAIAGDTIIVKNGTYNFSDRFYFNHGGAVSNPVVWIGETKGGVSFVANHNATVDAFVMDDDCITMDSIYFYGQPTATRSVIQVNGNYVSLKNGESHYRAGNSSTDNDNIRGDNIKHFLMQNWVCDSSAWNAINLQTTSSTSDTNQGLRHLTFDNVEIKNMLNHNGINIFPNTAISNPDHIDSVFIKNCYVHDNYSGASALLSRNIRKFMIYNNIFQGDIAFASGNTTYADTMAVEFSTHKSIVANNTFISTKSKTTITNFVANGILVENNIFYTSTYFAYAKFLVFNKNYETNWSPGTPVGTPIYRHFFDYNLYYQGTDSTPYFQSWGWADATNSIQTFSYATWQGATYSNGETHSLHYAIGTNPTVFTDYAGKDYTLHSSSVAKNVGVDLSTYFTTDKNGVTRTGTWDLGAYNYTP